MVKIVEAPTRRVLPMRRSEIRAVVLHTTGSTDHEKIIAYYGSRDGLQPHWYIQADGTSYHIVEEAKVAYHCKIEEAEAEAYSKGWPVWSRCVWDKDKNKAVLSAGPYSGYADWRTRWPTMNSPLDLVTGRYPNSVSIGIEMEEPDEKERTRDKFTDLQYEAARMLLARITDRHGVKLNRSTVLGHYDCSPMRRSTNKGGWDPGIPPNGWERIFQNG